MATRTGSSTQAEDATADIPLTLEPVRGLLGATVDTDLTTESCEAPFDLNLENRTVDAAVVCTAGTTLRAGSGLVLVAPGDLTLRAGQRVELTNDFEAQGGSFTAEIDPDLEP